ncbi:MAG: nucleotide sugar dehydrogenase [Microthrixaceae bacterium]|nr:nucleotide sugar dehydrogenase [Microthrixaceae bacterium]
MTGRPVVAVQGLGFVGAAMSIAVASALDATGEPLYDVMGVDLDDSAGLARVAAINEGRFPFETTDADLVGALVEARARGNLSAGTDAEVYGRASVIVVDVPLDIDWRAEQPALRLGGFEAAIRTIGRHVMADTLVLVETTVPPGTTEKIVVPLLAEELSARGLDADSVLVAHSYERVMPGADYYDSIVHYWRVYAGHTEAAADAAQQFLETVIDTANFPLTRVGSTTASETAKVLENTFRATTIALMDEWGRFAESVGVDLYEVVDAIRMRPTHANMRTPGFGVGGYCLTKDPLFAKLAASELWRSPMEFPFSTAAVRTNDDAPRRIAERIAELLGGSLDGRRILLLGISYRQDVGDTRYSPSETFVRAARDAGAEVVAHDPLVSHWDELGRDTPAVVPPAAGFDAVVFAVSHREYRELDLPSWLGDARPLVYDGFGVLDAEQRRFLADTGCRVESLGRGSPDPLPTEH